MTRLNELEALSELAFVTMPVQDGQLRETLGQLPGINAEMIMRVAEFQETQPFPT